MFRKYAEQFQKTIIKENFFGGVHIEIKAPMKIIMKMKNDTYQTQDFFLAVSLLTENIELELLETNNSGRATFTFPKSKMLEKIVADYFGNKLLVNPILYEGNRKNLKSQLISLSK